MAYGTSINNEIGSTRSFTGEISTSSWISPAQQY
jgi:hypothetical protein